MKNTNTLKTTLVFASLAILSLMASCRKKTDEGETITTIKITLKKAGMADAVYTWKDLDGNGGANPILPDTIQLRSDSSYISKIEFLNELLKIFLMGFVIVFFHPQCRLSIKK